MNFKNVAVDKRAKSTLILYNGGLQVLSRSLFSKNYPSLLIIHLQGTMRDRRILDMVYGTYDGSAVGCTP